MDRKAFFELHQSIKAATAHEPDPEKRDRLMLELTLKHPDLPPYVRGRLRMALSRHEMRDRMRKHNAAG